MSVLLLNIARVPPAAPASHWPSSWHCRRRCRALRCKCTAIVLTMAKKNSSDEIGDHKLEVHLAGLRAHRHHCEAHEADRACTPRHARHARRAPRTRAHDGSTAGVVRSRTGRAPLRARSRRGSAGGEHSRRPRARRASRRGRYPHSAPGRAAQATRARRRTAPSLARKHVMLLFMESPSEARTKKFAPVG